MDVIRAEGSKGEGGASRWGRRDYLYMGESEIAEGHEQLSLGLNVGLVSLVVELVSLPVVGVAA